MKKRLLMLLLATTFVFSGSMAVYAEEETEVEEAADDEVTEIDWEEYEAVINEDETLKEAYAGDFVEMDEIAVKIYVPEKFDIVELEDEDIEEGYIAYFQLGDDYAVAVQYVDMDEMELDEYAKILSDEFDIESTEVIINGMPALLYDFEEDGRETGVVAFATEAGYILEVSFADVSDEGFAAVAEMMTASIQPVE